MQSDDPLGAAKLSRRQLLAMSALALTPVALAACQPGARTRVSPAPRPTATPTPPPLTSADWEALAQRLQGTLIRPGDPPYPTARQLFDPRFDQVMPAAIAECASVADTQVCLAFAQRFGMPLVARCGGHSYAGYSTSTGLVLDVTPMHSIQVDEATGIVEIGAGARLIDIYAALAAQGLALPAGSCPSVGIAGLALGGGVGVLGRKLGLTSDNLLAAQITLADGRTLTCDASHDPDLFWALRGAGGGNFGVVTSFRFQTHPLTTLTLFTINWPWSVAAEMVGAWQAWAPHAPDELWSNCLLLAADSAQAEPIARVNGVYVGGLSELQGLLRQLTGQISAAPLSSYMGPDSLLDAMMIEAGCFGETVAACHLPSQNPAGQVARATEVSRSDYIASPLPSAGIAALVSAIATRSASAPNGGGIGLDAMGGAINRIAPDATAFVHRQELCSAQYTTSYAVGDPPGAISASLAWLDQTWQAMRPFVSGGAYQNYIDPNLPDWLNAYYGANLPRLRRVKSLYDPHNFFRFAQSIPLPDA